MSRGSQAQAGAGRVSAVTPVDALAARRPRLAPGLRPPGPEGARAGGLAGDGGEEVGAGSVPPPGATGDTGDVVGYARHHLAASKVPRSGAVRPEPLPRNPNGKVLKAPLRKTDFGGPVSG